MVGRLPLYKIVVLGDGGVGKTALVIQMCLNHFVLTYDPTIEDAYRKQVKFDGETCMLEILDTAGQEEYKELRQHWICDGEGFVLVYSITSRSSFSRVLSFYHDIQKAEEIPSSRPPKIVCLVGNKSDKVTEREVSTQEGSALARELGCTFFEASSKNAINVEKAFRVVVAEMRKQRQLAPQNSSSPRIIEEATTLVRNPGRSRRGPRVLSFSSFFRNPKPQKESAHDLDVTQQTHLNFLLVQTARRDKRKTAKRLLAIGADPNGESGQEGSALYASATLGHSKMVIILLDAGAAINAQSARGSTPLIGAAAEGHVPVVEVLLARGASVDAHSDTQGTAIIAATFRNQSSVLKLLLRHKANVNQEGGQYSTALHTAAIVGNVDIAEVLLNAGANLAARDKDDCTPLQVAAAAGHAEIVRLLLLRGARPIINDTRGKYGSALKAANDMSHSDVFELLVKCGAKEETLLLPPTSNCSPASELAMPGQVAAPAFGVDNISLDQPHSPANASPSEDATNTTPRTVSGSQVVGDEDENIDQVADEWQLGGVMTSHSPSNTRHIASASHSVSSYHPSARSRSHGSDSDLTISSQGTATYGYHQETTRVILASPNMEGYQS